MKLSLFLLATAALLGGCVPESQHPLSAPAKAMVDDQLEGAWTLKKDRELAFIHFHRRGESTNEIVAALGGQWTDVVQVVHEESGGIESGSWAMFPTNIGEHSYMNVIAPNPTKAEDLSYMFMRYKVINGNELHLWRPDVEAFTKAIDDGRIKGKVSRTKGQLINDVEVRITDTTENLAAFLTSADAQKVFADLYGTFRKVPVAP